MRKSMRHFLGLAAGLLVLSIPVFAHHGTAAYETDKSETVTGTVTKFDFTNPHVILAVNSKDGKGNGVEWEGELTSPNHLMRAGWSRSTLKPGEQITISGFPAKSGANTMWIRKIVKADGQPLTLGGAGDN